jgi:hypothetical protein
MALCLGVFAIGATACGHARVTRLSAMGISVDLPRDWHGQVTERRDRVRGAAIVRMGRNGVLLELDETLRGGSMPPQSLRLDRRELHPSSDGVTLDRYVETAGRAFALHATFRAKDPPARLFREANAVLARVSIEPRNQPVRPAPDPLPDRVRGPVQFFPTPARVLVRCRRSQARVSFPVLCPRRLPRPFIGWPGSKAPRVTAYLLAGGVGIAYGGPWEPDSGPDWRLHLWRNRPCCFLHFEVFRRSASARSIPDGARPATLGGRHGLLKDATSWGLASPSGDYLYWPNHTRFLWRERGVDYVASLHRFGSLRETRTLLGRLIGELRPVRQ